MKVPLEEELIEMVDHVGRRRELVCLEVGSRIPISATAPQSKGKGLAILDPLQQALRVHPTLAFLRETVRIFAFKNGHAESLIHIRQVVIDHLRIERTHGAIDKLDSTLDLGSISKARPKRV